VPCFFEYLPAIKPGQHDIKYNEIVVVGQRQMHAIERALLQIIAGFLFVLLPSCVSPACLL
jgi:hypothetical protein